MCKIVKRPIADWLPYPPPLYINIGFGLCQTLQNLDLREMNGIIWLCFLSESLTFAQSITSMGHLPLSASQLVKPTVAQSQAQILADYDKWTSPNPSKPTDVFIRVQLRSVNSVDMAQELFDVDMSIQMRYDFLFGWL